MEIGTWMLLLGSIAGEGARRTLEKNGCRLNEPPSMVFSALVKKTSMLQTWFRSSRELLDLKGPCGQRRVSAMGFILFHLLDALALQKIPNCGQSQVSWGQAPRINKVKFQHIWWKGGGRAQCQEVP